MGRRKGLVRVVVPVSMAPELLSAINAQVELESRVGRKANRSRWICEAARVALAAARRVRAQAGGPVDPVDLEANT